MAALLPEITVHLHRIITLSGLQHLFYDPKLQGRGQGVQQEQKGIAVAIWADEKVVTMKNVRTGETSETTLEKLLGEQK